MAMTVQDWQEIELKHDWREIDFERDEQDVESRRHRTKANKPADPMAYLAVVAILAVIGALVMFVYAIRTANEHSPHRESVNMMYRTQEE
jgi:hypothetical protein